MNQFNLLLDLCRQQFKEVEAVSAREAAKFERVTNVRGVACSYRVPQLQELAVNATNLADILQFFTNWGAEKCKSVSDTKLLTALMPKENVIDLAGYVV